MYSYQICGVLWIIVGSILIITNILYKISYEMGLKSISLVEGTHVYKIWASPITLSFACYFFNVTNPDEVMQGEHPRLVEYGPLTYDEIYEKQVIDVDEEMDEIKYTTKSTYTFNKAKSIDISNREKVTILNPAYIGTISMLSSLPPNYMEKYGDHIPKLFPDRNSIFLKARPTDILFGGVKISCNLKKFPELDLVCKTMNASPPIVLRKTEKEDTYLLSLFQRSNNTLRGPFTINRGFKVITSLGNITSYQGEKIQSIWNSDVCNTVRGTDSVNWAPLIEPLPFVVSFVPEMCRAMEADYSEDVSILRMTGSRFVIKERVWFLNASECYCLLKDKNPRCLPQGLIDVTECQKVPAILSEPHFLHGDPELLMYAHGLQPDENLHATYITIEPLTGTPLFGTKKSQVNLELTKQPVKLLSNVSEGFFPIVWCENVDFYRSVQSFYFLKKIPLIVGIYIIIMTSLYCNCTRRKVKPTVTIAESVLISSNSGSNDPAQEFPQRGTRAFE
ncbi:LOW QUALITY PROTEIN: sensory neuron membrane protein 2-like [Ceratina calcarata]|uniref:LOW QUALITY PROTEIN: sensory neuron membrane protein 2-like n=1 Tax=Ceratina calcarata TaxID=156304 RepID=A0AAJ7IZV5_9HYME|nr:LOW QUALITY PROTEIN: sensory neuron membrane protein 2-like [Ceratina calcarata]